MTLVVLFPHLRFRQFKRFYLDYARRHLRAAWPTLPSYNRCVELLPRGAAPVAALFESRKGPCDGISLVDATPLAVGDKRRSARPRVFTDRARRGKTSIGWCYGFKLHISINSKGELIRLKLTPGNVDDRNPLPKLCQGLIGYLFAAQGYIGQRLTKAVAKQDIHLITTLRKNMKPAPRTDFEKALLRRRGLSETVFDEWNKLCQSEHPRHRSIGNFLVNVMAGIVASGWSDHKPTLKLTRVNALAMP